MTRTRRAPSRGTREGTDEPRYTTDYYSMETVGKRTFLRMLYLDVRPSEAARRIAAERGDVSPMTVDREEEEDAPGEKEVLRRFAYIADRRRAKRQQPADAGVEQPRPPGRCGQGVEIGREPRVVRGGGC